MPWNSPKSSRRWQPVSFQFEITSPCQFVILSRQRMLPYRSRETKLLTQWERTFCTQHLFSPAETLLTWHLLVKKMKNIPVLLRMLVTYGEKTSVQKEWNTYTNTNRNFYYKLCIVFVVKNIHTWTKDSAILHADTPFSHTRGTNTRFVRFHVQYRLTLFYQHWLS